MINSLTNYLGKDDIVINLDKFESGESNILLITGLSGSGKTTLAEQLANDYDFIHVNLDFLTKYFKGTVTRKGLIESNEYILLDYISKKNPKEADYNEYLYFLYNYCNQNKDKKYIIEGVQIIDTYKDCNFIKNMPLIIRNVSRFTAVSYAAKKNAEHFQISYSDAFLCKLKNSVYKEKLLKEFISYLQIK